VASWKVVDTIGEGDAVLAITSPLSYLIYLLKWLPLLAIALEHWLFSILEIRKVLTRLNSGN